MNESEKISSALFARTGRRPNWLSWLRSSFLRRRQMRSLAAAIRAGAIV